MTAPRRGFTLVEIVFAMLILSVVAVSTMEAFKFLSLQSVRVDDRAFATQKAVQMMEELRGLIADSDSTIGVLDDYDNGSSTSTILTTRVDVTDPADPVSGNPGLKFSRKVTVSQINDPLSRRAYVRVYDRKGEVLAETVSVLRTIRNQFYPSQVYDVYVLVLENVPGWWVSLSTMRPMFDNVVQDLQVRNPGLVFRTHYVTRLSYGRDPYYTPTMNDADRADTAAGAPEGVYLYPGLVNKSGNDFHYYVPSAMSGRRRVDGSVESPASYSMADQYNHAVRYPEEEDLYSQAVAATPAGQTAPEISWRMLLERLNNSPGTDAAGNAVDWGLKNAIIVNMHGELVPLPPMRNYSDAAKDPQAYPSTDPVLRNVRSVAHPEQLRYNAGSMMNIRVYTYVTDLTVAEGDLLPLMTVCVSTEMAAANISVRKMSGNSGTDYSWSDASTPGDYEVDPSTRPGWTVITLKNSPLRHRENGGSSRGLNQNDQLYKLEYIPSLVSNTSWFQENNRDLADATDDRPKNTARWVIRLRPPAGMESRRYTIETRLGSNWTTGSLFSRPYNLSRTYSWVGVPVPVTERYQFMGDPRHMPYADLSGKGAAPYAGYNRYFNNDTAASDPNDGWNGSFWATDYPGYDRATRWNGGPNFDVPRYFQLIRTGLINGHGFWSSITGFSSFYVGVGGEMGYDGSNGFSNSLPIVATAWDSSETGAEYVQEMTDSEGDHRNARLIARTDNSWNGWHWLGELFPDDQYNAWVSSGNLPVGPGNFYRRVYDNVAGLSHAYKRTSDKGAASFFNGNPSGNNASWFTHQYRDSNTATLEPAGSVMAGDFNFPLVPSTRADRPFLLNNTDTGRRPPEWSSVDFPTLRTTLSTREVWYEPGGFSGSEDSSSFIRMTCAVSPGNAGGVVMNGLSPQDTEGSVKLAKQCVIGLVRGFMLSGEPGVVDAPVPQVPLVNISSPTVTDEFSNPTAINVTWSAPWTRWDSQSYTSAYPAGYVGGSTLYYNVKYSKDNGRTWFLANTTTQVSAGVFDVASAQIGTSLSWSVPSASFPTGNYLVRVEVYRSGRQQHYSFHSRRVFIRR
jgi:prepilin-type N-terminal cleavage/methylation domain-containing protein